MRIPVALVGAGAALCLLAATPVAATATGKGPVGKEVRVTADYQMNEPVGSTVMTDSSGNGLDGAIVASDQITTGWVVDGATGYHWLRRAPEPPPAQPERVIQVPDNINLEPGNENFTIEIRYRTKEKFGNIIQKGQAQARGGQWKIQNPKGIPSCLFKGSIGRVATGAKTPLNDNLWHTLTCVRTSTSVTMYVDGVFRNRKNGSTGTIDNNVQMTVGGKINCDQITTTCDYFSGEIDYVTITKG